MADVVKTPFDDPIEDDVSLEQTDNETMPYGDLLANAENIFKAFLYLKEMFSSAPIFNKIVKIDKIEGGDDYQVIVNSDANLLTFKNFGDNKGEIVYNNNDPIVLFPYEQIDIPYNDGDVFKVTGDINVIQIQYELR